MTTQRSTRLMTAVLDLLITALVLVALAEAHGALGGLLR